MILGSCPIGPEGGHAAGRALLRELYTRHIGPSMPHILITPRGKPYFSGNPVFFSISHTKNHVFCALSPRPIGIDAEELYRDINLRLAEKILSEAEYSQYLQAEDPRTALLTFWVLKEAQAKLTGEGLRGYPNTTDFSLDDPRVHTENDCLLAVLEDDDYAV